MLVINFQFNERQSLCFELSVNTFNLAKAKIWLFGKGLKGDYCASHKPSHHINFMLINPLLHMPILGSFNSAANKDTMSKILTNGDTIF